MEYYDSDGKIRSELLDTDASNQAKAFVSYFKDKKGDLIIDKKNTLSSSQLRRFYNEFKSLQKKIGDKDDKFKEYLHLIKMVKSKASYAANRPQN